jgi:hypothetical protein
MSKTFTLYGKTSELSSTFFPPLELDPKSSYALGLVGFYSYNSIPNIDEGNNIFRYKEKGGGDEWRTLELPVGSYEVEDLERYINEQLWDEDKENDIRAHLMGEEKGKLITIRPNNNTLKCEMRSENYICAFKKDSFGPMLGFKEGAYPPGVLHKSDLPVNIIKVTSIRVECNIITEAYYNGLLSHTLYEFPIEVPPGYRIHNTPTNVIYMPINTHTISSITLKVCDQDGDLINFREENIVVRLELRKL